MIFLYILLGILFLLFFVLMLRIKITVSYNKESGERGIFHVFAGTGPVRIKLYPRKKKTKLSDFSAKKYRQMLEADKKTVPKKKVKTKKKKEKITTNELFPNGISEIIELVSDLVKKFTSHLRCEILTIRLTVGSKNAASTALTYSGITNSVEGLIELIDNLTDLRLKSPKDVFVNADFGSNEITGDINIRFSIRIINILRSGGGFLKSYLRALIRQDKKVS